MQSPLELHTRNVFDHVIQQWKMSGYCEKLQYNLAQMNKPVALDKIVGVACNSLAWGTDPNRRSMEQYALLLTLQSHLSPGRQCYIQDPAYSQADKEVLEPMGFTILDDPEAFLMMNESSIVISISANVPVKQIVADICRSWHDYLGHRVIFLTMVKRNGTLSSIRCNFS